MNTSRYKICMKKYVHTFPQKCKEQKEINQCQFKFDGIIQWVVINMQINVSSADTFLKKNISFLKGFNLLYFENMKKVTKKNCHHFHVAFLFKMLSLFLRRKRSNYLCPPHFQNGKKWQQNKLSKQMISLYVSN